MHSLLHPGPSPIARFVDERIDRFEKLARKTRRKPSPDHVHDLRVLARKFRSDFGLIATPLCDEKLRRVRRNLRRLGRILGEQRKYDVAMEDAERFHKETKELSHARKKSRKQVQRLLTGRRRKAYVRLLKKAARSTSRLDPAAIAPSMERIRLDLLDTLERPPGTNRRRHALRISAKKARYCLEALGEKVPGLDKLQDHLGKWHDLLVLEELIGRSKELTAARNGEWNRVERLLEPVLRKTAAALDHVLERAV